ncbi:MAG: hypothetical protein JJE10_06850 [Thermoleophilia bacterium]|nr:hypothetical protein [Thermoleophilia bacterium]
MTRSGGILAQEISEITDRIEPVTRDVVIAILRDEQGPSRLFEGFLREFEAEGIT